MDYEKLLADAIEDITPAEMVEALDDREDLYPSSPSSCPMAVLLREKLGLIVGVGTQSAWVYRAESSGEAYASEAIVPLKTWQVQFIFRFDRASTNRLGYAYQGSVSAALGRERV